MTCWLRAHQTPIRVAPTTRTMNRNPITRRRLGPPQATPDPMQYMVARHINTNVPTTRQDMPMILIPLERHHPVCRVPIYFPTLFIKNTCRVQTQNHKPTRTQSMMREGHKRTVARRCRGRSRNYIRNSICDIHLHL
jgi:hypothetical protein